MLYMQKKLKDYFVFKSAKKFNLPFGQNYFKQNVSITLENMMIFSRRT